MSDVIQKKELAKMGLQPKMVYLEGPFVVLS